MNNSEKLFKIINNILIEKNEQPKSDISINDNLKNDLGLESFDMVELVVALEDEYGIDIFESGQVESVKDILEKINIKR